MTKSNLPPPPPPKSLPSLQTIVLKVFIHCEGCRRKIKRIIYGLDGVEEVNIEAGNGRVTVVGAGIDVKAVLQRLQKHGKHAEVWPNAMMIPPQRNNNNNVVNDKKPGGGKGGAAAAAGGNNNLLIPGGGGAPPALAALPAGKKLPPELYAGLDQLAMFDHEDDAYGDEDEEFFERLLPQMSRPPVLPTNGDGHTPNGNAKGGNNNNKKQQQQQQQQQNHLPNAGAPAVAPAAANSAKRGKNKCGPPEASGGMLAELPMGMAAAGGMMPRPAIPQQHPMARRPMMMEEEQQFHGNGDWGTTPCLQQQQQLQQMQQYNMYGMGGGAAARSVAVGVNAALRDSADYATHMFSDENANNCRIM